VRNKLIHMSRAALLLGAVSAHCLQAQEYGPYKFDFKSRMALYTGEMRDINQENRLFGFGLQVRRELFGPNSSVSVELTWEHVPSMHHDIIDYAKHSGVDKGNGVRETDHTKGILNLHPYWSFEDRKEGARGFSLLVGYYSKMPTGFGSELLNQIMGDMEWFAGLRFDRYNVYSEFKWQLRNQDGLDPILPPPASSPGTNQIPPFYHTVNGVGNGSFGGFHEEGASIVPGAFAGIKYTLNNTISFELGARYFGRKHWEFTPITYYNETFVPNTKTKGGTLTTGTTAGYGLEAGLVWKL